MEDIQDHDDYRYWSFKEGFGKEIINIKESLKEFDM